jgi:hypothetical protein
LSAGDPFNIFVRNHVRHKVSTMGKCHPGNFGGFSVFCFCIFVLTGCGTKKNDGEKIDKEGLEAAAIRDDVLKSLRSSQVAGQLKFSRQLFDNGLLNDVDRANHYLKAGNKGAAAANLGIYMSDLSCLIAHGKRDEANRYFQACLTLSEFIGMKKQFNQAIHLGFNEIITGDQKLEKTLDVLFEDASNTAEQDEFKKLHASALTGYYLEELYLLAFYLKSYRSTDSSDSLFFAGLSVFANQNDELNNLITYFDHVQLKSQGISAYQDLLLLQSKYLTLNSKQLLKETDPKVVLKDKSLQDIFDSLLSLRQRIVNF